MRPNDNGLFTHRLTEFLRGGYPAKVWGTLVGISVLGVISLAIATPYGLGLGNDSVAYIGGARSLLAGMGYRRVWLTDLDPIVHFPPLFSTVLAVLGLTRIEILHLARGIILFLYGLNGMLTGYFAWRITGRPAAGILTSLAFFLSHPIFQVHLFVMSEPLYLSLSGLYLVSLVSYLHTRRLILLVGAGFLAGLAFLTRYVGIALIICGGVWLGLLILSRREKVINLVYYLASSSVLVFLWLLRNFLVGGSLTNRQFIWHPVSLEKICFGLDNITTLFLPGGVLDYLTPYLQRSYIVYAIGGFALLIWLGVMLWREMKRGHLAGPRPKADRLLLLATVFYSVIYVLVMLTSMSLYDAATIFEHRILVPVYIALILILAALFAWLEELGRPTLKVLVFLLLLLWFGLNGYNQARKIEAIRYDAPGFASRVWKESKTIHDVQELLIHREIFTNKPTLIYILTNRASSMTPTPVDSATVQVRREYQEELERFRQLMNEDKAALVILGWEWMDDETGRTWYREITQDFTPISISSEGTIFLAHP